MTAASNPATSSSPSTAMPWRALTISCACSTTSAWVTRPASPSCAAANCANASSCQWSGAEMNNQALLLARLLLGVPFVIWGALKLSGGAVGLSGGLTQMGLPAPLLLAYLIGLFELVGG